MSNMLVPLPWQGSVHDIPDSRMSWLESLPGKTYCALWQRWPECSLPPGYDLYVVSFHLEAVDLAWLHRQTVDAPIILLSDSNYYDAPLPLNVLPYTYYWWHHQLGCMQKWFPRPNANKNITHKFSAICNRITQSKLIITTVLLEQARQHSIIRLNDWQGIDARIRTNCDVLDDITETFYHQWYGKIIELEDTKQFVNKQNYSGNPWTSVYQNAALHFTNESFHYSYMEDSLGNYTYPGPFITEKTLKCLLGGTGFIPVGQYDTYRSFETLGLQFNYGFNTEFDNIKQNLTRLEKTVKLMNCLIDYEILDLYEATKQSCIYNQDFIYSGEFGQNCEQHNKDVQTDILDKYS